MGKQIRFVLTQNKQKLLINKAIELAKKNNLVIIYENYILKDNAIPTDKFITLYLIERNDLEKVYPFLNYNQINDLIENSLEVTMNVSDDFELNDYSRLWIDTKSIKRTKNIYIMFNSSVFVCSNNCS